jgi:hypothetical protein
MMSALGVYGRLFEDCINYVTTTVEEKRELFSEQNKIMHQILTDLMDAWGDKVRVRNKEAAAFMILELGFTVADCISGGHSPIPADMLKHEMLDMIYRYLCEVTI